MAHLRLTTHFDAPIEQVFELATDFKRYPEWNVTYIEVKEVTGPTDTVGTKVHSIMKFLGRQTDGWGEIVEVERPKLLKMAGSDPNGGKLELIYRFTPADSGTDAELESDYELPAGLLGQIADKLFVERAVERDVQHSMENFKALLAVKHPVVV
jgi:uncharacterized protein YndB with AHSA1/START domain